MSFEGQPNPQDATTSQGNRGPINLATIGAGTDPAQAARAKGANAYLRTRVLSASPEELRLLLLEGAVRFTRQGMEGLAAKQYEQAFAGLSSARDIVIELMTSIRVDVNPELANNVKSLYVFIYQQLVEGGHDRDMAKLGKVAELLEYEVETWKLLMAQLAKEKQHAGNTPNHTAQASVRPSTDAISLASSGGGMTRGQAQPARSTLAVEG